MNKPNQPIASAGDYSPAYDDDAYGWAIAQAQLIRERQLESVDWDNVAEEIESLGRREFRSAESALRVVLLHQLKWKHQVTFRSRSWENSIRAHLELFDEEIASNPGLKAKLDDIRERAYRRARFEAAQETGLDIELFPKEPPSWTVIRGPLEP